MPAGIYLDKIAEAVAELKSPRSTHQRCSVKKLFLKISQYSRETPVLESLFNKAAGLQACNFIKKRL